MKPAKPSYYDPALRGKRDGNDMDDLPPIASAPAKPLARREAPPKVPATQSTGQTPSHGTNQSPDQPNELPISQPTNRPASLIFDSSEILGRPKSFYITKKQDENLDLAVSKLEKKLGRKVNQKIDRSTIIRLLLEEADPSNDQTVDRLARRLVSRLISQLTS